MHSRLARKAASAHKYANNRFLNTPQKADKLKTLTSRVKLAEKEIQKLKEKIQESSEVSGVCLDEALHRDLVNIMKEEDGSIKEKFPEGSFQRLFWSEQMKAAAVKDARQMRWHPTMIRWCLNLKLLSTSAYHSLRTLGFMKLPSERTLRDYTNFFQSKVGFQAEVDKMLIEEAKLKGLPE